MLCLKGMLQFFLIDRWQLHGMQGHVHVVLGNQGDAPLCGQLGLEAVAVVQVAVVSGWNVLENLNAFIGLRLRFLGALQQMQETPAVGPQLTPEDRAIQKN